METHGFLFLFGLKNQVWQNEFSHLLRIRFATHHAKCSQCLRHRCIIKKLGHCPPARRAQFDELQKHLARQLADRRVYWYHRGQSRLDACNPCPQELCIILDSMDMAKYSWPKSPIMNGKDFCSWGRPRMACTSMLAHGHMVLTVLSHHAISTNSSRTTEILSYALSKLPQEKRIDFRHIILHIQGDNCSKECKNNTLLRHFAWQIAMRKLKGCQMSFLSSGHSHEDIDSMFSNLRAWLSQFPDLHTPARFCDCLERYFSIKKNRANEPLRDTIRMDRFRDWILP